MTGVQTCALPISKFKAIYAQNVPVLLGKDQWDIVDPGFKLHAPVLTRPPGRPQKNRIRASAEGGVRKKRKCGRCGGFGHIKRSCTNAVDPSYGEEDQWGEKNSEEHVQPPEEAADSPVVSAWYVCTLFHFSRIFIILDMWRLKRPF